MTRKGRDVAFTLAFWGSALAETPCIISQRRLVLVCELGNSLT